MTRRIIPRTCRPRTGGLNEGARTLRVAGLGASHPRRLEEGYEPAQIRRLWSIVTYQRNLGINLAGVEVILRLVDHLSDVHHRVYHLAEDLRGLLDQDDQSSVSGPHD